MPSLNASFAIAALVAGSLAASPPEVSDSHLHSGGVRLTANTYGIQPWLWNGGDQVTPTLAGRPCGEGQCTVIEHPASLSPSSIPTGVTNLDTTLANDLSTGITVIGISQGAQVITEWLNQHGNDAARQGDVAFVLIGSPESKGGFRDHYGFTSPSTPEDSGYTVVVVTREYDGWAYWPTSPSLLSVINATMGMSIVHNDYESVDDAPYTVEDINAAVAADPEGKINRIWKSGDTYYVVNRTDLLPIVTPLTWIGLNNTAKKMDAALRPIIDADYDLPEHGTGIVETGSSEQDRAVATEIVSTKEDDTVEGGVVPSAKTPDAVSTLSSDDEDDADSAEVSKENPDAAEKKTPRRSTAEKDTAGRSVDAAQREDGDEETSVPEKTTPSAEADTEKDSTSGTDPEKSESKKTTEGPGTKDRETKSGSDAGSDAKKSDSDD